jgi:polysaccharide export outer membrane protein
MRKMYLVRGLAALVFSLAFCSSSFAQQVPVGAPVPQYSDRPSPKEDKERKTEPAITGSGAAVDSNTYKIGASDVLKISVWDEEKFSGQMTVQQNGKFTMPLVGDIDAGEHTPKEVEAAVAKALTRYVVKPLVTVTVMEVGSKKYYLVGMVNHPGEYPLAAPTTILDAISKSGGLQDFANKKKIYVLRGNQKIMFNYKEVINGKNMDQNIFLKPEDHVVVN